MGENCKSDCRGWSAMEHLKDPTDARTKRFIKRQNKKYDRFFRSGGGDVADDMYKEMKKRVGKGEMGPVWTDEEGITYQFVWPKNAEYEVLNRNHRAAVNFNLVAGNRDLSIGDLQCHHNVMVVGVNFTGE